jgi:signal transduction histidine kinase/FixJ family two-component response regulator
MSAVHPTTDKPCAVSGSPRESTSERAFQVAHERAIELLDLLLDDRQRTETAYVRNFGWLLAALGLAGLSLPLWGLLGWARVELRHPEVALAFGVVALVTAWLTLRTGRVQPWMRMAFAALLCVAALAASAVNGIHGLLMVPLAILVAHHMAPPWISLGLSVLSVLSVGALAVLAPADAAVPWWRLIGVCIATAAFAQWQSRHQRRIGHMTVGVVDGLDALNRQLAVALDRARHAQAQAERALWSEREAQARAQAMRSMLLDAMEGMSHGLIVLDDRDRIIASNQRFAELLQLPDDMMARQPTLAEVTAFQTLRGDFNDGLAELDPQVAQDRQSTMGGTHVALLHPYARRDRHGRTLEFATFRSAQGFRVRTVSDITAHRNLVEQLAQALAQRDEELERARTARYQAEIAARERDKAWESLQTGMQMLAHGVMVKDAQGWIEFWNPRMLDLLGLPADFFNQRRSGQDILRFQLERGDFGADGDAVRRTIEQQLASGGRLADGSPEWVDLKPTTDGRFRRIQVEGGGFRMVRETLDGRFIENAVSALPSGGVVHVYSDVTDFVRARDELQHSLAQLRLKEAELQSELARSQEAVTMQAQFVAAVSHELRTPLNGLAGMTDLLAETATTHQAEHLRDLRASVRQLRRLTDELLDLSRASAPGFTLESTAFDLFQPLRACAGAARMAAGRGVVAVRLDLQGPSCMVMGDELRLSQVVNNLLTNALKFTEAGEVCLTARINPAAGDSGHVALHFSVADTGRGIDPALHADIFEPFHQGPASTNRTHGGTGLGLALCRQIVRVMGGTIAVQSQVGQGATFTVCLPFRLASAGDLQVAEGDPQAWKAWRLDGRRVLVADDNRVNQRLMRIWLEAAGARVLQAIDGPSVVRQVAEGAVDAVLMDVAMPGMTGVEATQAIRARERALRDESPAALSLPLLIIGVTAMAREQDRAMCLDAGMDTHLAKPVDRATLLRTLHEGIEQRVWTRSFIETVHAPGETA